LSAKTLKYVATHPGSPYSFSPVNPHPAGHDLPPHLRPAGHSEKPSAAAEHASSAAAAHASADGGTHITHITNVNLDGKRVAQAIEKHQVKSTMQNMKQSMLAKGAGHGTLTHPAVATGNP
jgi:hypothetical protein